MGPPGSGKTTIGQILAHELQMNCYDLDNDHLETVWDCPVADKLQDCGDDLFLSEEAHAIIYGHAKVSSHMHSFIHSHYV